MTEFHLVVYGWMAMIVVAFLVITALTLVGIWIFAASTKGVSVANRHFKQFVNREV